MRDEGSRHGASAGLPRLKRRYSTPRLITATAVLLALAYGGICTWFYTQQRSLLYFPDLTRTAVENTDFEVESNGLILHGWRVNPGKSKAVVYFDGNGGRIESNRENFAAWFPDSTVYLVAYRGYGANDGSPDEASLFADALNVFDRIQELHPNAPIAAIGYSLGTGVASYLASRRPVARLALIAPFDSMVSVAQAHYPFLPMRWLVKDRYESTTYLPTYRGPVLIVRAAVDPVVFPANTERLVASLPSRPRVVEVPDASHDTVNHHPRCAEALMEFLR